MSLILVRLEHHREVCMSSTLSLILFLVIVQSVPCDEAMKYAKDNNLKHHIFIGFAFLGNIKAKGENTTLL